MRYTERAKQQSAADLGEEGKVNIFTQSNTIGSIGIYGLAVGLSMSEKN